MAKHGSLQLFGLLLGLHAEEYKIGQYDFQLIQCDFQIG